jgi:membrane protein YdbS with pleckstrin-like domain
MIFRAGRNFYRWQLIVWALSNVGALAGTLTGYIWLGRVMARMPHWALLAWHSVEILGLVAFVTVVPFTYLALHLNYELRWYIVTDRSLRIRRGIWRVEELTMTFTNIQDIRVTSGPLQNWLGLADVEVRSAGGAGSGEQDAGAGHVASFQGIDNANELRELIVERLRQYRDSGLGDTVEAPGVDPLEAAREVLEEIKALRTAIAAHGRPGTNYRAVLPPSTTKH